MKFTLFLQLPTPIPDLVSYKYEECIYEYHCFEDEKTGPAKRRGTLIQPLYYPTLSLYVVLPSCKLNYETANFKIF